MSKKHLILPLLLLVIFPVYSVSCQDDLAYWLENEKTVWNTSLKYTAYYHMSNPVNHVGIYLFGDGGPEIYDLEFKLIRLDGEPEVLAEKNVTLDAVPEGSYFFRGYRWEADIPPDSPAEYRIGVIRRGSNQSVISAIIDTIKVPFPEEDLIFYTGRKTYISPFETLKVYLKNSGQRQLLYWPLYWYEKYENGEWVHVPYKSSGFPAIAYELEPGNPDIGYHFIPIEILLPGKYRICKDVWEDDSQYPIIVSSEFYYPGTILNALTYLAFFIFLIRLRKKN